MRKNVKKIINRVLSLLEEAESYEFHKETLLKSFDSLFRDYQAGMYSHAEYNKLLQDLLKRRTKKEWVQYYDSYIYSILKQTEPLISQIIYYIYNDDSARGLSISGEAEAGTAEARHEKEKRFIAPTIEEDRKHQLRRLKEKDEKAREFVEFEKEPLIGAPQSPLKEKYAEEIGKIRQEREKVRPGEIKIKTPEIKGKKLSLFQKIAFDIENYIEKRRVRRKKEYISRELEKARRPSIFYTIMKKFGSMKPELKKPKPVKVKKPSVFASVAEGIRSMLRPRERLELREPPRKQKAVQEKERMPSFLFRMRYVLGIEKAPPVQVSLLKKDSAMDRLFSEIDTINKSKTELKVSTPRKSVRMKIDLFMIRLHTSLKKKRLVLAGPAGKMEGIRKPAAAKVRLPEIKPVKIPIPGLKEKGIALLDRISAASARIKSFLFVSAEEKKPAKAEGRIGAPAAKAPQVPGEKPWYARFRFSWSEMRESYRKMMEREKIFVTKKMAMTPSLQMQALKEKVREITEEEQITPKLLREEVESIQKIISEKKKYKVYQPSFIGSFANATIRKFTFYLIEKYPAFFKTLYDNLRLANIKVLSNTYVNIMILTTIVITAISSVFFFAFFLFTNNPFLLVIPKTLMMAMLSAGITFMLFYSYPQMQAKNREHSINTNLPFAINHISAVAGSGVPPTKMFKLIMESEEYGEIAVEIEKIVEYVELFGYDLLTAVRSVAFTTPSAPFKEFLEGMVSTIESGGDLNVYLKEKTSEAMLTYELERQKYTETISTYSDIYTGILIAAPLFFIVALSLVSMLGGTIGGIEVNVVIVGGAYVVIPVLNVLFLIILELTQPEV